MIVKVKEVFISLMNLVKRSHTRKTKLSGLDYYVNE